MTYFYLSENVSIMDKTKTEFSKIKFYLWQDILSFMFFSQATLQVIFLVCWSTGLKCLSAQTHIQFLSLFMSKKIEM